MLYIKHSFYSTKGVHCCFGFFATIICIKNLKHHYINLCSISNFHLKKRAEILYKKNKIKNINYTRISTFKDIKHLLFNCMHVQYVGKS